MTSKEKYEKLISTYKKSVIKNVCGFHKHHIYPKSIWPEAKDEPDNLVELPPIMHWYAHKLLNEAFIELNMPEYAERLSTSCDGIAQFINKDKPRLQTIDFSKEKDIVEFLDRAIDNAAAEHDMFIKKRDELINEWKDRSFVWSVVRIMTNKQCINLHEPLAYDITTDVINEFGFKSGMPNIFDIVAKGARR